MQFNKLICILVTYSIFWLGNLNPNLKKGPSSMQYYFTEFARSWVANVSRLEFCVRHAYRKILSFNIEICSCLPH